MKTKKTVQPAFKVIYFFSEDNAETIRLEAEMEWLDVVFDFSLRAQQLRREENGGDND
jgi:hypothetical protein